LLEEVTFLVEYPTVILGNFNEEYLALPRELLITVMKSHQRYFSVEDKEGNLLPHFVLVSNTKPDNNDTVRRGAERVLKARLEDAKFYYSEDQKKTLWDHGEHLKDVTFQETLGSMYEKVERIARIGSFLAEKWNLPEREKIHRASVLSKADLVTGVVREFPELQGYAGMVYAINSGEDKMVASAIHEHYMPRYALLQTRLTISPPSSLSGLSPLDQRTLTV
jgi:glycyl-tRNA synthetase beta chain